MIRLVEEALQSAEWRTEVDTGRYTFPVGNNGRNVNDGAHDGGQTAAAPQLYGGAGAGAVEWSVDEL